jgi:hypothetical protein
MLMCPYGLMMVNACICRGEHQPPQQSQGNVVPPLEILIDDTLLRRGGTKHAVAIQTAMQHRVVAT